MRDLIDKHPIFLIEFTAGDFVRKVLLKVKGLHLPIRKVPLDLDGGCAVYKVCETAGPATATRSTTATLNRRVLNSIRAVSALEVHLVETVWIVLYKYNKQKYKSRVRKAEQIRKQAIAFMRT